MGHLRSHYWVQSTGGSRVSVLIQQLMLFYIIRTLRFVQSLVGGYYCTETSMTQGGFTSVLVPLCDEGLSTGCFQNFS